jgi:hypothetical protein
MANLPISQLPELTKTGLTENAEYVVSQGGVTYKIKESELRPFKPVYGLYSQTEDSVIVSGTTTESSLIGNGIGFISVPQNGFSVGDSFSANLYGLISSVNNDTIRIRVRTGGVLFLDSAPQTTISLTDDSWELFINFTIRQVGPSGVAIINSSGSFHTTKKNSTTVQGFSFNNQNNSTFDTTINNALEITVQWGSSDSGNKIYSDIFNLTKIF